MVKKAKAIIKSKSAKPVNNNCSYRALGQWLASGSGQYIDNGMIGTNIEYNIDIENEPVPMGLKIRWFDTDEWVDPTPENIENIDNIPSSQYSGKKNKVFTLKSYNDLGRCSYGTLKDTFNTETDKIYLKGKLVEINTIKDLFPFLWQQPGISGHCDGLTTAHFNTAGATHWHQDFDESIMESDKRQKALEKKIAKTTDKKKKTKYNAELQDEIKHKKSLQNILQRCDKEMKEQQKLLIEENK